MAVLGGVNTIFSILTPMFLSYLLIQVYPLMSNKGVLLTAGLLSTLYRGLSFLWNKEL